MYIGALFIIVKNEKQQKGHQEVNEKNVEYPYSGKLFSH